jgi:AraC-like DNA-binding protein
VLVDRRQRRHDHQRHRHLAEQAQQRAGHALEAITDDDGGVHGVGAGQELLGGERVTTIAYDLGYSSPAAFTVMFKQLVGLTPNLYRARHSRAQTGGLAEPAEAAARRGRLELY